MPERAVSIFASSCATLLAIGWRLYRTYLGPYLQTQNKAHRIGHLAHILGLTIVLAITAWSGSSMLSNAARAQSRPRHSETSLSPQYDHDSIVEHGVQIQQLQSAGATSTEERKTMQLEMKYLREKIESQDRDIASAKAGVYTLVTAFGLILTGLSILQHFTLRRKVNGNG